MPLLPSLSRSRQETLRQPSENVGVRSFADICRFVQEIVTDPFAWGEDGAAAHRSLLERAQAGDPAAVQKAEELVAEILRRYGAGVEGMDTETAAHRIYAVSWGLDVLEDLYRDPEVDEIQVNRYNQVFVVRRGKNERCACSFENEEHVKRVIARLLLHDRGVALTSSTPAVESVRLDGTRITATCPDETPYCTLVLRKHDTFKMTPENLYRAGTLNKELLDVLARLVQGRANILISGGTGSGKTSLLRFLVRYLPEELRIVTLETDRELRLAQFYPERNIVEFAEHREIGRSMREQFRTTLRYSPDVIIVGEIRGKGEAVEAIKACTRGHSGSMATIHFSSPEEAVEGAAKMMLEEGLNLPLELAVTWVAQAFNVVVQMFSDSTRGIKKITRVVEVWPEKEGVGYRDLAVWEPSHSDYFTGRWVFPNLPSERLLRRMEQYGVYWPAPAVRVVKA